METIFKSMVPGLKLVKRGKVRDVYDAGDNLLLVATDRLSAFDVILPDPIPWKGAVLTTLSNFWFDLTKEIIENHVVDPRPWQSDPANPAYSAVRGRCILGRKAQPLMIEAIVRGYLTGSGWSEYQKQGSVCGIKLPPGLKESARLPTPIFTPTTKAPQGEHDENINFEKAENIIGRNVATQVREKSIAIYNAAAKYALERGIILADTKFEFGMLNERIIAIDELLTPDSSRFWPLDGYAEGRSQPSFDKQFVRDYLISIKWDRKPPAPKLPAEIITRTSDKYREALKRLAPQDKTLNIL